MGNQTNKAGKTVPDTATTYERAKHEQESPSKKLSTPPAVPAEQADELARNAQPASQKKAEA